MAEFISHYQSLGFYVDGEFKKFNGGRFVTDDEAAIAVLKEITDAQLVEEAKAEPKTEEAPKAKPKAPAKKSSGK